jgi:hypothetical protein
MKPYRLSLEELKLLQHLSNEQLSYFSDIGVSAKFQYFKDLVNYLIDQEKDIFFVEDESRFDDSTWKAKHAYARGGIAKLVKLIHIIYGSNGELMRRDEERKKKSKG